jgi:hypothetical protein
MRASQGSGGAAHGRNSSSGHPSQPKPSSQGARPGTNEVQRTVVGLGVPVAPSFLALEDEQTKAGTPNFLALEDEETKAYDPSALLAECQNPSERVRDSSGVAPPTAEANLHRIEVDPIEDAFAPTVSRGARSHSRPRSSRRHSFLVKFLFVMIMIAAAVLLASELSVTQKIPWLDPRPLLTKGLRLAKEKIPWERLPKMPGL